MARVYDIVEKIKNGNEKPTIKIEENHEYTINTSKNTALFIKAVSEDKGLDDFEKIDKTIESGLGKEALDYINSLDLSTSAYVTIVNAIMAAIGDVDLEEIEKAAKEEQKKFRKR